LRAPEPYGALDFKRVDDLVVACRRVLGLPVKPFTIADVPLADRFVVQAPTWAWQMEPLSGATELPPAAARALDLLWRAKAPLFDWHVGEPIADTVRPSFQDAADDSLEDLINGLHRLRDLSIRIAGWAQARIEQLSALGASVDPVLVGRVRGVEAVWIEVARWS
jgi:hypothetical protein